MQTNSMFKAKCMAVHSVQRNSGSGGLHSGTDDDIIKKSMYYPKNKQKAFPRRIKITTQISM